MAHKSIAKANPAPAPVTVSYSDEQGETKQITASVQKRHSTDQKVRLDPGKPDQFFFVNVKDVPIVARYIAKTFSNRFRLFETGKKYVCSKESGTELRKIIPNPSQHQARLAKRRDALDQQARRLEKRLTDYQNRVFASGLSSRRLPTDFGTVDFSKLSKLATLKIKFDSEGHLTPESIKLITEVALAPSRQGKKKRAALPPGEVTLFKEINDFKKAARAYEDDVIIYENFLEMNCKPEA